MDFDGKQQSLLTFRVGPVLCCAPSLPVRSIITPPPLTHPPGSDSSQPGIFKHGSHIVKVLDLRQKFGINAAEQTQPGNLIITFFENENVAFWVDQILDVFEFPSEGWSNLPAAIPRDVYTRTLLLNKKIYLYSEFEKLATIQDLSYLKNYIQQLEKRNDKGIDGKKSNDSTISKPTNTLEPKNSENKDVSPQNNNKSLGIKDKQTPIVDSSLKSGSKKEKINTVIERRINPRPLTQQPIKTPVSKKTVKPPIQNTLKNSNKKVDSTAPQSTQSKKTSTSKYVTPVSSAAHTADETKIESIEENSSFFGVFIFLLVMLSLLSAGFYYLLPEEFITTPKYEKQYVEEIFTPILQPERQEFVETADKIIETISIKKELASDISTEPKKITEDINNHDLKEDNTYRANISQINNEIIITLHQTISSVEPIIKNNSESIKLLNVKELNSSINKEKIINEILHIVVKGDTLWAIAKRYVNNPFLYPELARLSNIKNPHRIYPGNRVRIRFIKN